MKIGIDAKWYFEGPPSGKVVVRNLVESIIEHFPQHEYFIFLDKKFKNQPFPISRNNVKIIYLWGGVNLISNAFLFPLVAWKYHLDVVIFQNFVPVFTNFQSIAYIHDVIFESDPQHFSFLERCYFALMKLLSRRAKRICTVSKNEKLRMIKYGYGDESSIDVIYNGVGKQYRVTGEHSPIRIEQVIRKYNLPEKFLLYIGRLNDRKNLRNLIESLTHVSDKSIQLLLFGKYDWKSINLDEIITRNSLKHRVFRKGFADQEDLPVIYSLATVFTFVSYEEGFGLPILEAMASGVPCVVADIPVFRELFSDCVVYANPHDPNDIAAKISLLIADKNMYHDKRKKGLLLAKKFSWEQSAKTLLDVVESVK